MRKSRAYERDSLVPPSYSLKIEEEARLSHPWAVDIVERRFKDGLAKVFDGVFVSGRFTQFLNRADPIYVTLLQGMNDDVAARALVGHWMVAHTLATQTRFWLEDAIVDILRERPLLKQETRPEIYSLGMLAEGWHSNGKSLWNVGERWKEELHGRGAWQPLIQEKSLDAIERLVGEEERRFETEQLRKRDRGGIPARMTPEEDLVALKRVSDALGGSARPISVRCNLLIVEPDAAGSETRLWAVRYINPSTFSNSASIKAERANLLRIRAWIAQEKPFRAPNHITVAIADMVDRADRDDASARIASHFSELTRWTSQTLWDFLRVPFAAVTAGIRSAGAAMQQQLVHGLAEVARKTE